MCFRLVRCAIRCEPMVDRDHGIIGDDVSGNAAGDGHGLQTLAVLQAIDRRRTRDIGMEPLQHCVQRVDRVLTHPRTCGVGAAAVCPQFDSHRALATGFDNRVRRFHQDCEVGMQQFRTAVRDALESVELGFDLLAFVEDVGDVARRCSDCGGEFEFDGCAALHVAGAEPVQPVLGEWFAGVGRGIANAK